MHEDDDAAAIIALNFCTKIPGLFMADTTIFQDFQLIFFSVCQYCIHEFTLFFQLAPSYKLITDTA